MSHLFMTNNYVLDADLSMLVGTENANFLLDNLKVPISTKAFRATGSNIEFMIDLGSIYPLDIFCLTGDNIDGLGATSVSIYGSTTNNFSSSVEIVVDISQDYNFGFKQFTENSFRYWKVVMTGSTYCELSNIYLGKAQSLETNAIDLASFKYTDTHLIKQSVNAYGNRFQTPYATQKSLSGDIRLLNTSELAILRNVYNESRRDKPLFFIADPEDALETDGKFIYSGMFWLDQNAGFGLNSPGLWNSFINLLQVT